MQGDLQARRTAPRVLIVEPERAYLGVLARRLTDSGFRVAMAETVQQGVAELYRQKVDIILAELTGRKFSGAELIGIVRGEATLRDTPILMLTGRSDDPAAAQALRAGADAVVKKPFHFEVLIARIERELDRRRTLDELRHANRTLDERVTERAIALGEMKDRLARSEAERLRLELQLITAAR